MNITHLLKECLKGRTLGRAIQNFELAAIQLKGKGVDLGASTDNGSYYEFLHIAPDTQIAFTDLIPKSANVTQIDIEKELPIETNSQDFLILNNVLHVIYHHQLCINECYRILKPGGVIIGVVPFFHSICPDPDDYFRYTRSSLVKIFSEAGFSEINIEPLGYGVFSSCANAWATIVRLRPLIFLIYTMAIGMDKMIQWMSRNLYKGIQVRGTVWSRDYLPIYFMFKCRK
jgi:SAM-dependent methyltransferase